MAGLNDITFEALGFPARTADEIIAGHRQLIERAHVRGLAIIGPTLLPFEGSTRPPGFTGIIEREGDKYVALCPELDVASQGRLSRRP